MQNPDITPKMNGSVKVQAVCPRGAWARSGPQQAQRWELSGQGKSGWMQHPARRAGDVWGDASTHTYVRCPFPVALVWRIWCLPRLLNSHGWKRLGDMILYWKHISSHSVIQSKKEKEKKKKRQLCAQISFFFFMPGMTFASVFSIMYYI